MRLITENPDSQYANRYVAQDACHDGSLHPVTDGLALLARDVHIPARPNPAHYTCSTSEQSRTRPRLEGRRRRQEGGEKECEKVGEDDIVVEVEDEVVAGRQVERRDGDLSRVQGRERGQVFDELGGRLVRRENEGKRKQRALCEAK
jgi:hypothetical protein